MSIACAQEVGLGVDTAGADATFPVTGAATGAGVAAVVVAAAALDSETADFVGAGEMTPMTIPEPRINPPKTKPTRLREASRTRDGRTSPTTRAITERRRSSTKMELI